MFAPPALPRPRVWRGARPKTAGFAGSLPWDDGEHTYTSAELSELEAGNVSFYAYSYIEGPEFGFPFSTIQDNKSNSYIYLSGSMVLE